MPEFEVLIVGAGLVGTSLAFALAEKGFKIAILEQHLPTSLSHSSESRPLSLNYASQQILLHLGLWDELKSQATAITTVLVSNENALGTVHFRAQELKVPALGFVIPLQTLQHLLYQKVSQHPNIELFPIQQILSLNCEEQQSDINVKTTAGEKKFSTKLLIAADGSNSTCRELLGITVHANHKKKSALIANVTLKQNQENMAYERFTAQGILAVLPLQNPKHCRLVLTLPKPEAEIFLQEAEKNWLQIWQQHFKERMGAAIKITSVGNYDLEWKIAQQQIGSGFILMGNAAHTIYPLAAQGFNLGLRDVAALCDILNDAKKSNNPLGTQKILQKYVAWREPDQKRVLDLTQGVGKIFDLNLPGLNRLRGLGLLSVDLIPPLKRKLARQWMGMAGKLPTLILRSSL